MGERIIKYTLVILSLIAIALAVSIWYQIFGLDQVYEESVEKLEEVTQQIEKTEPEEIEGNRLIIPKIGIDMEVGEDFGMLDTGGWVQTSQKDNTPAIIAIHRYGLDFLSAEQKSKQTLYHVDKLEEGDKVFVYWEDEKLEYVVDRIFIDDKRPDMNEDELILYTCELWESDRRWFVRLIRVG